MLGGGGASLYIFLNRISDDIYVCIGSQYINNTYFVQLQSGIDQDGVHWHGVLLYYYCSQYSKPNYL